MTRGKNDKLTLERVPVARDNNTILMVKPGYLTCMMPCSTDNCSNLAVSLSLFFLDQFTSEAVAEVLECTNSFTGKRFSKEWDDIFDDRFDSGSWICVDELYM